MSEPQPRFTSGDVEFERAFRAHPWERTRLGAMKTWPPILRGYAEMILKLPTPAIIFWGPDQLQIYNAGYAVIMGPRHPKYLGATYAECWPDTYPTIHPWMDRVLQGEVMEVVNAPFTLTRHGYPEETYFTFSFSPLTDDSGAIGGFLQLVVEKTAEVIGARKEKAAHEAAERERANIREFFMQTPAPLCILSGPDHRYVLANKSFAEMVGQDVVGKTVREAFPPESRAAFEQILDRVYATGEPFVGREVPLKLGDRNLLINLSYTPVRGDDGKVIGILVFAYDITREASAVRAREEFLGIASHELRTPLTALRLQIQMAQRGLAPVEPEKLLKQTMRLTRLVDDMLDISRIRHGKLTLERGGADLSAVVGDVLDRFEPQLRAGGSQVNRALGAGVRGQWDAYRLEQVITNLITNAMKYAPGRPIDVTTERRGDVAVLTVADHGRGVAPEDRERIFERFERATNANEVSGLGLGLFISRQIVEAHGGRIAVQAGADGGAVFSVELPLS